LGGVKGVGTGAVEMIIREREKNGPFKTIFDFVERVNLASCNRKNIEALCLSGAFDNFQEIIREQFFAINSKGEAFIDSLIRYGNRYQADKQFSLNSLFGGFDSIEIATPEIPACETWNDLERLNKERELVGIYLSSHPLDEYYIILNYVCTISMKEISEDKSALKGRDVIMAGLVISFREGMTQKGKLYGILKLEDYTGSAEIPLFGNDYFEFGKYCRPNTFLLIKGQFQARQYNENVTDLKIKSVIPLVEMKNSMIEKITINLSLQQIDEEMITELSSLVKNSSGNSSFYFKIEDGEKQLYVSLASEEKKFSVSRHLVRYLEEHSISFKIN
jgi:DNA polymerase-3 subunit alpha